MQESIAEWERPEKCHKLLEMTLKVLEPHTVPDQRANSLILASGTGESHIISCGKHYTHYKIGTKLHCFVEIQV